MRIVLAGIVLLLGLAGDAALAETKQVEIEIGSNKALADLVIPAGGSLAKGVVLLTHGTLAHKDMELIEALQAGLASSGVASLAASLTFGIDSRKGMYDCPTPHRHRHEDATAEIGAWLAWLRAQGAGPVTLMGHSRGGNQTAWYAANGDMSGVSGVVLLAPTMISPGVTEAAAYKQRYGGDLASILAEASRMEGAGKGAELMTLPGFLYCPDTRAAASSVLSYYGPRQSWDTTDLIERMKVPVLVIAASADTVVTDVAERVRPVADGNMRRLEIVDGADHFFLDLYAEDAASLAADFVKRGS